MAFVAARLLDWRAGCFKSCCLRLSVVVAIVTIRGHRGNADVKYFVRPGA
jgi:hypothetical protein